MCQNLPTGQPNSSNVQKRYPHHRVSKGALPVFFPCLPGVPMKAICLLRSSVTGGSRKWSVYPGLFASFAIYSRSSSGMGKNSSIFRLSQMISREVKSSCRNRAKKDRKVSQKLDRLNSHFKIWAQSGNS